MNFEITFMNYLNVFSAGTAKAPNYRGPWHSALFTKLMPNKFRNFINFMTKNPDRAVLQKTFQPNIFLHAQFPNSYNIQFYRLQIFPPRESS